MIFDVSYLGWVTHHGFNLTGYDYNTVLPYTTWKPTAGPGTNSCGQVINYLDPTAAAANPTTCIGGAQLNSNVIRAMTGYTGWSQISASTNAGEVNYNALQVQINKRFGRRLQFGANYNFSKQLGYSRNQFLPDYLTYNVNGGNRPQVVNINFGYKLPNGTQFTKKNVFTQSLLDGWNLNGVLSFYNGTPLTVGCAVSNQPVGYWYGTPTNTPGLRCQMNGSLWLPDGTTPGTVGSVTSQGGKNYTTDARLWYPFAGCGGGGAALADGTTSNCTVAPNFVLPSASSFGIGNTPLALTYGPGFENADISMSKEFRMGKETRVLQFRAETFNTLNHMNPGNPGTTLTYNYQTLANNNFQYTPAAQTTAGFGVITGVANPARRLALSLRLRF